MKYRLSTFSAVACFAVLCCLSPARAGDELLVAPRRPGDQSSSRPAPDAPHSRLATWVRSGPITPGGAGSRWDQVGLLGSIHVAGLGDSLASPPRHFDEPDELFEKLEDFASSIQAILDQPGPVFVAMKVVPEIENEPIGRRRRWQTRGREQVVQDLQVELGLTG
jgi:hypothetical protein